MSYCLKCKKIQKTQTQVSKCAICGSRKSRFINPIQDGPFRGCSRMGGAFWPPKIGHTYPSIMKLGIVIPYPEKIQNFLNYVTDILRSPDISIFSPENSKFCYIKKYRCRLYIHNFYLF